MMWGRKRNQQDTERAPLSFIEDNGSWLHEELITTFNGRHKVPLRFFTAKDLFAATNNFINPISKNIKFYKGSLDLRPILVKNFFSRDRTWRNLITHELLWWWRKDKIHDIVIGSQMSHHKNVWKLVGCCLEFKVPALVYEYDDVGGFDFLSDLLFRSSDNIDNRISSWTSRLEIANDIASAVVYLHMAFPTPIIYQHLQYHKIIIDQCGVAKLFDFSNSIPLPPGELELKLDSVSGIAGFMAPEYIMCGIVSQKIDVYAFGMLLLVLLTGKNATVEPQLSGNSQILLSEYIGGKEFNKIVDPNIMGRGTEQEQQLMDFLQLALDCIRHEAEHRPEMIDVARAIRQIRNNNYSGLRNQKVTVASSSTSIAPTKVPVVCSSSCVAPDDVIAVWR